MALSCQVSLNYSSYSAGQTPPPMATVFVYNPNAAPVSVTGIQVTTSVVGTTSPNTNMIACEQSSPPVGPGMTTYVPANSSINIGPFPIAIGSAANVNPFQMVNQYGNLNPVNPQGALPPQFTVLIGAVVSGSDLSQSTAGTAPLLVSYTNAPPVGFQGGFLQFNGGNNLADAFLAGIL